MEGFDDDDADEFYDSANDEDENNNSANENEYGIDDYAEEVSGEESLHFEEQDNEVVDGISLEDDEDAIINPVSYFQQDEHLEGSNQPSSSSNSCEINRANPTKLKTCRHFAYLLLEAALVKGEEHWELEHIGELAILIIENLQFNSNQISKLFQKTKIGHPTILAMIIERGYCDIPPIDLVQMIWSHADHQPTRFLQLMDDALECGIFVVSDPDMLEAVRYLST
jgi:hypothetical protein